MAGLRAVYLAARKAFSWVDSMDVSMAGLSASLTAESWVDLWAHALAAMWADAMVVCWVDLMDFSMVVGTVVAMAVR